MCIFIQYILLIKDNKGLGISLGSHQVLLMWLDADGVGIFQDSPDGNCLVQLSHLVSDNVPYILYGKYG